MKLSTIKSINKDKKQCYDITVENNHNFFCNGFLIHNCDYRNDIGVILINLGQEDKNILVGDKIAQLIFETYHTASFEWSENLNDTDRGAGGFGSTDFQKDVMTEMAKKGDLDETKAFIEKVNKLI